MAVRVLPQEKCDDDLGSTLGFDENQLNEMFRRTFGGISGQSPLILSLTVFTKRYLFERDYQSMVWMLAVHFWVGGIREVSGDITTDSLCRTCVVVS